MTGRRVAVLHDSPDFGGHEKIFLAWLPAMLASPEIVAVDFWVPRTNAAFAAALRPFAGPKLSITSHPYAKRRGEPFRAPLRLAYGRAARAFVAACGADLALLLHGRIENLATPMLWLPRGLEVVSYLPMAHSGAEMGRAAAPAALADNVKRRYYARPERMIVPSHAVADQARRQGARGPVHVVENVPAAAPANCDRIAARIRIGEAVDGRLAVFIGRFDLWQKGLDRLVRDLEAGAAGLGGWRFLFVGTGEGRDCLAGLLATGAIRGAIVDWTDRPALYLAAADALLLPSRFEGVPLVMLEALRQGTPVVASDIDVFREYLPHTLLHDFARPIDLPAVLALATEPTAVAAFADHAARVCLRLDPARSQAAFVRALLGHASADAPVRPAPVQA